MDKKMVTIRYFWHDFIHVPSIQRSEQVYTGVTGISLYTADALAAGKAI